MTIRSDQSSPRSSRNGAKPHPKGTHPTTRIRNRRRKTVARYEVGSSRLGRYYIGVSREADGRRLKWNAERNALSRNWFVLWARLCERVASPRGERSSGPDDVAH